MCCLRFSDKLSSVFLGIFISIAALASDSEEKLNVRFGGFVDTYYAYDFNNPQLLDRSFTTQPARHNEFNVNLAYFDAKILAPRIRGRFALQSGTSVQSNYANESNLGRMIQEATAGYEVIDRLWIDAGIFLSHIGFESWISRDNWTYSRSLIADYSPYYETGVKATYQWTDRFATQFLVLNGWQNIAENNGSKAFGVQVVFNPTNAVLLTYNCFIGNEFGSRRRFFNDLIAKVALTDKFSLAGSYDVGWQETVGEMSNSLWQGYAMFARYQFTPKFSLTARGEQYFDKDQAIVTTGTERGFQVTSASLNADFALHKNIVWRTEVRGFWSKDRIFPSNSQGLLTRDGFAVTSLALSF
jgi:hypothetical protein